MFYDILANVAVIILRVNVFGDLGSPYIDLAVGGEWEVKDVIDEQGSRVLSNMKLPCD
jgi:hypothetical protein